MPSQFPSSVHRPPALSPAALPLCHYIPEHGPCANLLLMRGSFVASSGFITYVHASLNPSLSQYLHPTDLIGTVNPPNRSAAVLIAAHTSCSGSPAFTPPCGLDAGRLVLDDHSISLPPSLLAVSFIHPLATSTPFRPDEASDEKVTMSRTECLHQRRPE